MDIQEFEIARLNDSMKEAGSRLFVSQTTLIVLLITLTAWMLGTEETLVEIPLIKAKVNKVIASEITLVLAASFYLLFNLFNSYKKLVEQHFEELLQSKFEKKLQWYYKYPTVPTYLKNAYEKSVIGAIAGLTLVLLTLSVPVLMFYILYRIGINERDVFFWITAVLTIAQIALGFAIFSDPKLTPRKKKIDEQK